jgi:hypothetical protein
MNMAPDRRGDSAKLVSLLALATGAVTMPQTGNADILYTDLSSHPVKVGFASGDTNSFSFDLPGASQVGFTARETYAYGKHWKTITVGKQGGAQTYAKVQSTGLNGLAATLSRGAAWNDALPLQDHATVGVANTSHHYPDSGYSSDRYLGWVFRDTTQPGLGLRYGWVEIGLSIDNVDSQNPASGPEVTIFGYAYGDPDYKIAMAEVPEPVPAAILALGALTLGAKGVRGWRRHSAVSGKS